MTIQGPKREGLPLSHKLFGDKQKKVVLQADEYANIYNPYLLPGEDE